MNKRKRHEEDDSSDGGADDINMNEMLDSEEEYSENERKLLQKARQKRQVENYDSEDEVMGFSNEEYDNEDEEEKDSLASDIGGLEEDFDLPNEKAWGKKKKTYYSTDYIDADYASASQKDIADAEMEEQEARSLQKRLAEQLDEADFGLDLVVPKEDDSKFDKDGEHIKADLSKLSNRQKQDFLEKESPEFMPLVTDFQDRLIEAKTILGPFLDLVERSNCKDSLATNFIKTKYNLLLHYCTSISFYLMLKAKRESVASHPVIKRLAQYRQLLAQLEEHQGDLLVEIETILETNKNGQPLYNSVDSSEVNIGKKKAQKAGDSSRKQTKQKTIEKKNRNEVIYESDSTANEEEDNELQDEVSKNSGDEQMKDNNDETEAEKRAITYQIAKNKGLTPRRKKEQRNPRVKHRNKYRKAIIRRRGAVREVRKETSKYGGEISGIKASVKKSIKLK